MSKKVQPVKVTLNKTVTVQHLIVKQGLTPAKAEEVFDFMNELYYNTLMNEGKVVLRNVGTLELKVVPARNIILMGKKVKAPTRFKIKFTQSAQFVMKKSPLRGLSVEDELKGLSKLSFD